MSAYIVNGWFTVDDLVKVITNEQARKDLPSIRRAQDFYSSKLVDAMEKLGDISGKINLIEMVTPTNYTSERERCVNMALIANHFPVPEFSYDEELLSEIAGLRPHFTEVKMDYFGSLKQRLQEMVENTPDVAIKQAFTSSVTPEAAIRQILASRIASVEAAIDLAEQMLDHNAVEMANTIQMIYGEPSREIVFQAKTFAKELANNEGMDINTETSQAEIGKKLKEVSISDKGIKQAFRWAADYCGFGDTRPIWILPNASRIDVRDTSSDGAMVVIPEGRQVDGLKLVELTIHEVLCHWRDSENCQKLLPKLGGGPLKAYNEVLYEGHAVGCDYETGLKYSGSARKLSLPWYSLAEAMALEGRDFVSVTDELYRLIRPTVSTDKTAVNRTWMAAYRTFRGINGTNDLARSYAFTKDYAYFSGRLWSDRLKAAGLGHLLDLGTLSPNDLLTLASAFKIEPDVFEYPFPNELPDKLVQKILDGDFTVI